MLPGFNSPRFKVGSSGGQGFSVSFFLRALPRTLGKVPAKALFIQNHKKYIGPLVLLGMETCVSVQLYWLSKGIVVQ